MARQRVDPLVAARSSLEEAADAWEKAESAARCGKCGKCGARVRSGAGIALAAAVSDWRSAVDARRAKEKFDAEAPTRKTARPIK